MIDSKRTADHGLIFEGDVYVRNRNLPGAGLTHVGNTTSLTTSSSSDKKERTSKQKNTYGQALDSLVEMKPTEIGFTLDTFDRYNLAMALMGEDAVIEASQKSETDEEVAIVKRGQLYKLKHDNIDPSTVKVKNASSQSVDDADVILNSNLGLISIVATSSKVNDGENIKVTYKTRAGGGFTIHAGRLSRLDLEIMVDGKNRLTGESGKLHIPHATVAADGEIDWFGDDFNEAKFKGTAVIADGEQSPYKFSQFK